MKIKKILKGRESTLRGLIISFGFFNGVWIAIGIDPSAEIFKFIIKMLDLLGIPKYIFTILSIISLLLVLFSLYLIYKHGKEMGILAVLIAFVAGMLVLKHTVSSLIILAIAIGIGFIAERFKISLNILNLFKRKRVVRRRKYRK